ncbi:hypothetical protein F2P81_021589 [Scophthalmus maximus]|uniref:Uncharacterized protein n=1 Tax=Scophthalmus maximus TaxID=52904 RepID=A0A6A4S6G2_SCOMX|nr:hypothetical protein F2P81_021589 [Scophthalmus maximus]
MMLTLPLANARSQKTRWEVQRTNFFPLLRFIQSVVEKRLRPYRRLHDRDQTVVPTGGAKRFSRRFFPRCLFKKPRHKPNLHTSGPHRKRNDTFETSSQRTTGQIYNTYTSSCSHVNVRTVAKQRRQSRFTIYKKHSELNPSS